MSYYWNSYSFGSILLIIIIVHDIISLILSFLSININNAISIHNFGIKKCYNYSIMFVQLAQFGIRPWQCLKACYIFYSCIYIIHVKFIKISSFNIMCSTNFFLYLFDAFYFYYNTSTHICLWHGFIKQIFHTRS